MRHIGVKWEHRSCATNRMSQPFPQFFRQSVDHPFPESRRSVRLAVCGYSIMILSGVQELTPGRLKNRQQNRLGKTLEGCKVVFVAKGMQS